MSNTIRMRNIDPQSPERSINSRDGFVVRVLRNNAAGFAASQTITQNVPLTVVFDGPLCMNPRGPDGSPVTTSAVLALPSDLWLTFGVSTATIVDGRIEGIDHLGNQRVVEFTKATGQTTVTMLSAQVTPKTGSPDMVCWSFIKSLTMTLTSTTTTISVGTVYPTAGSPSQRQPRIALPVPIRSASPSALGATPADIGSGLVMTGPGGGTFTVPSAGVGRLTTNTPNVVTNCMLALQTCSVVPSTETEYLVTYQPGYVLGN